MTEDRAFIRRKILSDCYNRIIFSAGGEGNIYLVGGYLRDLLLKRKSLDRDYVIRGPFEPALSRIASALGEKVIKIGEKGLSRIVTEKGVTLDFSPVRTEIHNDLSRRDFTVNAMAWTPETAIIDDTGGMHDLDRKLLRMTSAANLRDDPVRVIRAYRLAAALSLAIDPDTRRILKALAPLIPNEKRERITLEFFKMLNLPAPESGLQSMIDDSVLGYIISCDNKALRADIKVISNLNGNLNELPPKYRKLARTRFAQNLSSLGYLRLSLLLRGLPGNAFSLSSKVLKYLHLNERGLLLHPNKKVLSKDELFELFVATRESAPYFLLTANLRSYLPDYARYLRINRTTFLTAEQIRDIAGLSADRSLGTMIAGLKKARFIGMVRNTADARRFVRKSSSQKRDGGKQERSWKYR